MRSDAIVTDDNRNDIMRSKLSIPDDYNYDDLSAYIKLADYKGIEYTKITGDVSDDEVKSYISMISSQAERPSRLKKAPSKKTA